eukprot:CAMPEP_0114433184 /NCGR_PEP_ID=MMETSP0103-20121206/11553_1 /TAXON_ID=37642 ORGANISM="Paraphysomonas imperforata, Strain PA2" /NCGR_SAMPLE_ID=MMETSP0103 /ASSEMBLY_ACC=CAM_ASM_000201 /LENGTH=55 /DNA_ID=CAMNT_0001602909 /DNA_START=374 /DNA_END=538 /DNA_ORIENTATION=-
MPKATCVICTKTTDSDAKAAQILPIIGKLPASHIDTTFASSEGSGRASPPVAADP